MPQVRDALEVLEEISPKRFAFDFDKVGLQVGDPLANLTKAVVALDRSLGAVEFAAKQGAQFLLTHHPLIFEPLASVLQTSHVGRTVLELARNNIAFAASHTNWDSAKGGINDALASIFDLRDVSDFGMAADVRKIKVIAFCPSDSLEKIVDSASEAGAGLIGEYSRCAFEMRGTGTFKGSPESTPTIGKSGNVEHFDEVRFEMVLPADKMAAVGRAIRKAHPYEEPAFDFMPLMSEGEQPAGRIGTLPSPCNLMDFAKQVDRKLETASWTWGDPGRKIKKVAIVGGAADSEWRKARQAEADVLLTGEVKQHVGLEVADEGFAIIAGGHYATEQPGCVALRGRMAQAMPGVEWLLYVPEAGSAGRPFTI